MITDFCALCAELLSALESWSPGGGGPLEGQEAEKEARLLARTRAALADEPAVPDGKEPAAVTGQPSDEELTQHLFEGFRGPIEFLCDAEEDAHLMIRSHVKFARAVLARWGNHQGSLDSSPPADGEVAELVADMGQQANHGYCEFISKDDLRRAAELLQRQALVPVAVSERLPGPEDCDDQGRCWWLVSHQSWPCLYLMKIDSAIAAAVATHWLPAHAVPIPQQQESDNG